MKATCVPAALLTALLSLTVPGQVVPPSRNDATFGTIVSPITQSGVNFLIGGATDLVLDESRGRLYLVNSGQRRIEIYSVTQRRFLGVVQTDPLPMSAALARDNSVLYVTSFDGSAINVVDLERLSVVRRVSLPAKPEGLAAGYDGRVLISTIGTGLNNLSNTLLIFDPNPAAVANPIQNVIFTPPPPPSPLLPAPAGRPAFAPRTNLTATRDGRLIIGFNATGAATANQRALFVYDVASQSILRSRTVNETATTLSVSPDGTRAMAGLRLFDLDTLQVIAQQNAANLPYTLPTGSNFNVQQNQGGSVFAPDGRSIYSAFNFAPLANPPARANISQLFVNDPDNLLTTLGLKLAENLSGNMVISPDGATIYALSESGFLILPMNQIQQNPLAVPESTALLLANDQCGSVVEQRQAQLAVRNAGRGRFTVSPQLVPTVTTGAGVVLPPVVTPTPLPGGAGGGQIGGGIVIVQPPTQPGQTPGGTTAAAQQQQAILQTAPGVQTQTTSDGASLRFTFNTVNNRAPGTIPPHDFQLVAPEAINIPPQVRIYQNFRDTEARAGLVVVPTGPSGNEGLVDMISDPFRQRLYIANSGLNRVDVYDLRARRLLDPIKVGQLPRSLALTPDGNTLYVANSGGESISIVDPDKMQLVGRVKFPPLPFNSGAGILTPSVIAATQRGLIIVMSNGSLWRLIGDEAVPRPISSIIGAATVTAPRTLAATPNGEFALLLAGNGVVYLYDALSDEFVQSRQVFNAPITGFYGPITAGPRGQYFVVNGTVLSQALSVLSSTTQVSVSTGRPGAPDTIVPRPISAVTAVGATTYARFAQATRLNANTLNTEPPSLELVDPVTGQTRGAAFMALESPLSTQVGTQRVNINGRTLAVDTQGAYAYALTASGLSIIPLEAAQISDRPAINPGGTVNLGSYRSDFAPGTLISIFGRNLGSTVTASSTPLPTTLGGTCVTLNSNPIPLFMTSAGQINAQVPSELANGTYQLVVRSPDRKASSPAANLRVVAAAPAIVVDVPNNQPAIFHLDGRPVNEQNPITRDDRVTLYAIGFGNQSARNRIPSGTAAPSDRLVEFTNCQVFLGDPSWREAEMDVEWCGIVPGSVGLYQVNFYTPWYVMRGDRVPVTVKVGNFSSPTQAPVVPKVTVR